MYQFLIGYISNEIDTVGSELTVIEYQFLIGYISNSHIPPQSGHFVRLYQFLIGIDTNIIVIGIVHYGRLEIYPIRN